MGGTPTAALALVGVSARDGASREADLRQMMSGARAALDRLDVPLAGGHSIETDTPLIGFAVLGAVREDQTMTKGGASVGDRILLTKPLGTGVVLAATRAGECPPEWTEATITSMKEANDVAARCLNDAGIRCCTDVSGFGLAGHLAEMLRASDVGAELHADALPALPGALELLGHEWRSSADEALVESLREAVAPIDLPVDDPRLALLRDPQTSGGLVAAVPQRLWQDVRRRLAEAGLSGVPIGTVVAGAPGQIRVRSGGLVEDGESGLHQPHES
jgi:selenide,water dikinase